MYERLLKDIKKALYKVLGRSHLLFDPLQDVVVDIEQNVNNRPFIYVESEQQEESVLTPNTILWGQDVYTVEESDSEDDLELVKLHKRMKLKREHAWKQWTSEYLHSLMEHHRVNRKGTACPKIGEIVLVVGDRKNRGEWRKGNMMALIQGKDKVVRGVKILSKGHVIERPLSLVCSLEIRRSEMPQQDVEEIEPGEITLRQSERGAAAEASEQIRECVKQKNL